VQNNFICYAFEGHIQPWGWEMQKLRFALIYDSSGVVLAPIEINLTYKLFNSNVLILIHFRIYYMAFEDYGYFIN